MLRVLGLDRFLTAEGIDVPGAARLLGGGGVHRLDHFAADVEADGQVVHRRAGHRRLGERRRAWLVETVRRLAEKAGIGMPEVAIYEGEPNAFATGAFRNSALVAVSTGPAAVDEQRGGRGGAGARGRARRERRHGDAHAHPGRGEHLRRFPRRAGRALRRPRGVPHDERGVGPGFFITVIVCQIVFGILASIIVAWFSRQREFRADAGSRRLPRHAAAR